MKWEKSGHCSSVQEVLEYKTGLPIEEILSPPADPYIAGLQELALSVKAIPHEKKIMIYGDYDADGICGSAILYRLLKNGLGFQDVTVHLPGRVSTGYGFQTPAAESLIREGVDVLITVDNGVNAYDAIQIVKHSGAKVFVIDHHPLNAGAKLPEADVIVDPNADGGMSEYTSYCGSGLAYRLAKTLGCETLTGLRELAAIATITDVMDLLGDNRNLVKQGLDFINLNRDKICAGLRYLLETLGIQTVSTEDIGFTIGPCINAADRMNRPAEIPLRLFMLDGPEDMLKSLANELVSINNLRKETTGKSMITTHQRIIDDCLIGDCPLLVAFTEENHGMWESLNGILAGRLAEENKVPAFVLSLSEDGMLHGSGRSYGDIDIKAALDQTADLIYRYGGHPGAVGLTVKPECIDELRFRLSRLIEPPKDIEVMPYDLEITAGEIPKMLEEVEKYMPYGHGFPPLVFKITGFQLIPKNGKFMRIMGDGNAIKLFGNNASAVSFSLASRYLDAGEPKMLTIYGSLSRNEYKGFRGVSSEIQVEFLDFEKENIVKPSSLRALLLEKL